MQPQLRMFRAHFDDLAPVELPDGYRLRTFEPGDEAAWEKVIGISFGRDPGQISFANSMLNPGCFLPERVFFVCCGDEAVATAAAYLLPPDLMPDCGTLHYVGVLPGHAGRRLGGLASLAALHRFREEGLARGTLSTDDFRLPAVKTYLRLGFIPMLVDENQRQRWRDVFAALSLPELSERYAPILDGTIWQPPAIPPVVAVE
ncbi:MAG: GNAT family N-acetyltransferase [Victivallales bacterium]|jgi:mycothiol synthase|nr:GNAT family N-acetyltransferase [Victivallales bacterium]MBT7162468.1 GNAT family N-acetyltransferase [Victivallales bacterium]MBT7299681.1 GNAT family N-acetyltransferase [Victivallales bacterium]